MYNLNIFDIFSFTNFSGNIGSEATVNICVFVIGTQSNKRGFIKDTIGEITPNATFEGEPIYEATWDIVTGLFIISFGVSGNTYLDNVPSMEVSHPLRPDGNTAPWDETNTQYSFIDLELAQYIDSDPDKACFLVDFLPTILARYDMTVSTATGE